MNVVYERKGKAVGNGGKAVGNGEGKAVGIEEGKAVENGEW
jgi:hypothetical protein